MSASVRLARRSRRSCRPAPRASASRPAPPAAAPPIRPPCGLQVDIARPADCGSSAAASADSAGLTSSGGRDCARRRCVQRAARTPSACLVGRQRAAPVLPSRRAACPGRRRSARRRAGRSRRRRCRSRTRDARAAGCSRDGAGCPSSPAGGARPGRRPAPRRRASRWRCSPRRAATCRRRARGSGPARPYPRARRGCSSRASACPRHGPARPRSAGRRASAAEPVLAPRLVDQLQRVLAQSVEVAGPRRRRWRRAQRQEHAQPSSASARATEGSGVRRHVAATRRQPDRSAAAPAVPAGRAHPRARLRPRRSAQPLRARLDEALAALGADRLRRSCRRSPPASRPAPRRRCRSVRAGCAARRRRGSGTTRSATPSFCRSCAVRRSAFAASCALSAFFHRIAAQPSGEMTE